MAEFRESGVGRKGFAGGGGGDGFVGGRGGGDAAGRWRLRVIGGG